MFGIWRLYYAWLLYELLQSYFVSFGQNLQDSDAILSVGDNPHQNVDPSSASIEEPQQNPTILEFEDLDETSAQQQEDVDLTIPKPNDEPWPDLAAQPFPQFLSSETAVHGDLGLNFSPPAADERSFVVGGKSNQLGEHSAGSGTHHNVFQTPSGVTPPQDPTEFTPPPSTVPPGPTVPPTQGSPQNVPPQVVPPQGVPPQAPPNEPLKAQNDFYHVSEDGDLDISAPGVLDNDSGINKIASLDTHVSKGILTFHPEGSFTYDTHGEFNALNAGDTERVQFSYQVTDGQLQSDTATVQIEVTGVNDVPTAGETQVNIIEDTVKVLSPTDFQIGDVDNALSDLSLIFKGVSNGGLLLKGTILSVAEEFSVQDIMDSNVSYMPAGNDDGLETLSYHVRDPGGLTDEASIQFNIAPVTDVPAFEVSDITVGSSSRETTVYLSARLGDVDGSENLTVEATTIPAGVSVNPPQLLNAGGEEQIDGHVTITPHQNFTDPFMVTFTASAHELLTPVNVESQDINVLVGTNPEIITDGELFVFEVGVGSTLNLSSFQVEGNLNAESYHGVIPDSYNLLSLADTEGDGVPDLLATQTTAQGVDIFAFDTENSPFDINTLPHFLGTLDNSYHIEFMENMDGDADEEVIATQAGASHVDVFAFQTENAPFDINTTPQFLGSIENSYVLKFMGDLDGDGFGEIIATQSGVGGVDVFAFDTGNGIFDVNTTPQFLGTIETTYILEFAGDTDGDGNDEIIATQSGALNTDVFVFEPEEGIFDAHTTPSLLGSVAHTGTLLGLANIESIGRSGNDMLTGTDARDILLGLGGDDVLKGGGGDDLFVLDILNLGHDQILDFSGAGDQLEFHNVGSTDISELDGLLSNVQDTGGDITFNFLSGDSLTISGVGTDLIGSFSDFDVTYTDSVSIVG